MISIQVNAMNKFEVEICNQDVDLVTIINTKHMQERTERLNVASSLGNYNKVNTFKCDRGHPNGAEIHIITDNGLIIVLNYRTHKLVTILIARPQQIKRYYEACGLKISNEILNICSICYQHLTSGLNN